MPKCSRYLFEKMKKLDRQGREYRIYRGNDGVIVGLMYRSLGLEKNFNGSFAFKTKTSSASYACCRHFIFNEMLTKDFFLQLKREKLGFLTPLFRSNFMDDGDYLGRADRYAFVPIARNGIGRGARAIADDMSKLGKRSLDCSVLSENHAMSLRFRYKTNQSTNRWAVRWYEPNDSIRRMRAVFTRRSALRFMRMDHLMPQLRIERFFPKFRYALLGQYYDITTLSLRHALTNSARKQLSVSEAGALLHYSMRVGIVSGVERSLDKLLSCYRDDKDISKLQAARNEGMACLGLAILEDRADAIRTYMLKILSSRHVDYENKFFLFKAEYLGSSALYVLMRNGQLKAMNFYLEVISKSRLFNHRKKTLFSGLGHSNCPGLYAALDSEHANIVASYISIVLSSGISTKDKLAIISMHESAEEFGVSHLLRINNSAVAAYKEAILASPHGGPRFYQAVMRKLSNCSEQPTLFGVGGSEPEDLITATSTCLRSPVTGELRLDDERHFPALGSS